MDRSLSLTLVFAEKSLLESFIAWVFKFNFLSSALASLSLCAVMKPFSCFHQCQMRYSYKSPLSLILFILISSSIDVVPLRTNSIDTWSIDLVFLKT